LTDKKLHTTKYINNSGLAPKPKVTNKIKVSYKPSKALSSFRIILQALIAPLAFEMGKGWGWKK
jgi:hypothetical protein